MQISIFKINFKSKFLVTFDKISEIFWKIQIRFNFLIEINFRPYEIRGFTDPPVHLQRSVKRFVTNTNPNVGDASDYLLSIHNSGNPDPLIVFWDPPHPKIPGKTTGNGKTIFTAKIFKYSQDNFRNLCFKFSILS